MPLKQPIVNIVRRKEFSTCAKELQRLLLQRDTEPIIEAVGTSTIKALEVLNCVCKDLHEVGVIDVKYRKIGIGEIVMSREGNKVYIRIPCRVVREEEGYRSLRDLDQNHWEGGYELIDNRWEDYLVESYFRTLTRVKKMSLVGYGSHVIHAISIFNSMKRNMTALDVICQDVEIGSCVYGRINNPVHGYGKKYECGIKIHVIAKELKV